MPPQYLTAEEDTAIHVSGSKKRKADDASLDDGRHRSTPTKSQQTTHGRSAFQDSARKTAMNNAVAAATNKSSTSGAERSGDSSQAFMKDHLESELLEIFSDNSVGLDSLTSQVAIFGVLQHAHASATTGDELGLEYVRNFIARLARCTADRSKVVKVTEVLKKKLMEQCARAQSQIRSLGELLRSKAQQPDGKIAEKRHTKATALKAVTEEPTQRPAGSTNAIESKSVPPNVQESMSKAGKGTPASNSVMPKGSEAKIQGPLSHEFSRAALEILRTLDEPQRSEQWLSIYFAPDRESEIAQARLWQAYHEAFNRSGTKHLHPGQLFSIVSAVFPGASAQIVNGNKYIIRGIRFRDASVKGGSGHEALQGASHGNEEMDSKVSDVRMLDTSVSPSVQCKGSGEEQRMTETGHRGSPAHTTVEPRVKSSRPHHHVYPCSSSSGKDVLFANISADIRNYTEPGEDLDWTKVSDPKERKRLQGIVGARKYKERQLAAKGRIGSGGNYPGAAGEGSQLSTGYGKRQSLGTSQSRSPQSSSSQPPHKKNVSAKPKNLLAGTPSTLFQLPPGVQPEFTARPVSNSNGSLHGVPTTNSGKNSMVHHSPNEEPEDADIDNWLYEFIDDVQQVAATESPEFAETSHVIGKNEQMLSKKPAGSAGPVAKLNPANRGDQPSVMVVVSDDEQEVEEKDGDQGGQQSKNRFLDLMAGFTHKDFPAKLERVPKDFADDKHRLSLTRGRLSSTLVYDSDYEDQDPEDERSAWKPNAGGAAFFELDRPMKTAFNVFARSAHDTHQIPAKTRKNVVERYQLYIRQVWNLLSEKDKAPWKNLAAARGALNVIELSVKGQYILESQDLLPRFLPHVEPSFPSASKSAQAWTGLRPEL